MFHIIYTDAESFTFTTNTIYSFECACEKALEIAKDNRVTINENYWNDQEYFMETIEYKVTSEEIFRSDKNDSPVYSKKPEYEKLMKVKKELEAAIPIYNEIAKTYKEPEVAYFEFCHILTLKEALSCYSKLYLSKSITSFKRQILNLMDLFFEYMEAKRDDNFTEKIMMNKLPISKIFKFVREFEKKYKTKNFGYITQDISENLINI